jgi:hypothetical protein
MKATLSICLILVCLVVVAAQGPSELSGRITNGQGAPVKGVVVSVGSFSVATDANGDYKIAYLKAGPRIISLSPPGKVTKSFRVTIQAGSNRKDFPIDW